MCRGKFRAWLSGPHLSPECQGGCPSKGSLASEELLTVCSFNVSQTKMLLGDKT